MTAGPLHSGESLHFLTEDGAFADTNGWPVEVAECAEFDKPLPVRAFGVWLGKLGDTPRIRDLTAEFETAVYEAMRPEAGVPSSYVIRNGKAA
ncbi:hypothetical protein CNY89_00170 [Amaricoccus sp. HAR-UPW-R2A-40]|nr:hypothetical protein CNY89_00170 [Amaricoccus sp. HAR-UPW-R2A-40]